MNKRENALDIIRVISALLVVAVHVYTTPFHTAMAEHKATGIMTGAYIFYKIFRAIGELAIPIFLMLSGAFVFASDKTAEYKTSGEYMLITGTDFTTLTGKMVIASQKG